MTMSVISKSRSLLVTPSASSTSADVMRPVGVRDELVEGADGVAEPALGVTRDDVQRRVLDVDRRSAALVVRARVLALDDAGQQAHDVAHLRAAEVEALAAREDRLGDLVRLGGGEHEDDVVGGGSSSVLSRALKASRVSMWTSSTM